jgi:hypothetical protein
MAIAADLPAVSRNVDNDAWHLSVLVRKGYTVRIVGEGERGAAFPRRQHPPLWVDGQLVTDYADLGAPYGLLLTGPLGELVLFAVNDGQFARDLIDRARAIRVRTSDLPSKP